MPHASRTPVVALLEALESRSFLDAAAPAGGPAEHGPRQVIVADAGFLSAASEAAPGADAPDDSAMYDFGGVWGSRSDTQALAERVQAVDLSGGAVDQEPGGPSRQITPSDLSAVAPATFVPAKEYDGSPVVLIANTDPVGADSPTLDDGSDLAAGNVINMDPPGAPPAPVVAPPAPVIPAVGSAVITWIEIPTASKRHGADAAIDQPVIESTFIRS